MRQAASHRDRGGRHGGRPPRPLRQPDGRRCGVPFQACRDHAATEEILRGCGVPFTSLRNGFYAAGATRLLDHALETGEILLPADGPVAWTTAHYADQPEWARSAGREQGACFACSRPPRVINRRRAGP
ncbi:Rossmann-fold NAD(P)-binding domain-containing protein [Streptomyces sp. NPDC049744]|uniref:hypothetical protein n=1 Tax=Streptomyces sp. NPDC049744 TaxID=3154359 RepID=UPI003420546D